MYIVSFSLSPGTLAQYTASHVSTNKQKTGGTIKDSYVVKGIILETSPNTVTHYAEDAKVVVFTCALEATQTETKGTILLHNAEELMNYNKSEEAHIHNLIKGLHEMGVRVVIVGEKIGEMALHFLDKYKMIALRLTSKWTLRRLCRSLKARPCVKLGGVRPQDLGSVVKASTLEIGSQVVTVFSQTETGESPVSTIVLRGATNTTLEDLQRAADDGINMVRAMSRNGRFVAGAGACEVLSLFLSSLLRFEKRIFF